ncbi:MAG TPA: FIST N-terminal domain-containing protein [Phycisphaerales bacterium]|nr:FIST N-terminal domain-containing protein [Phycisphaerales bacterium]
MTTVVGTELVTFSHQRTARGGRGPGWSVPEFPRLDSERTLVLVFGAPSYLNDGRAIAELARWYPTSCIAGCSTSGEIHGSSLRDETLSVAVMRFAHTKLSLVTAPVRTPADSFNAGDSLARQLGGPGLRGVLVLSDGLKVNGSELIRGLNGVLPTDVVVTGGLAGDGDRFQRTWVLRNGAPADGFISAVGFYGDRVRIGHGSKGGWDVFGPERVVTRSEGNVLYELDGKPALPLYKGYLGERAAGLPATALLFPLALRQNGDDKKSLVRTVLSIDEKNQSLVFAGDIPQGSYAQLMRANFDRLIEGAAESALMTRSNLNGAVAGPCLTVAVSCVGRRLVLGERTEEELERSLETLPEGTKQVGFYSYGEISPYSTGRCDLHNQTMTLTTITET